MLVIRSCHCCFPEDKYDTLEYSRVKCYNSICALADVYQWDVRILVDG
jgi:hypothetical protein